MVVLRPYQQESLEHAKAKNTIVNIKTGGGKTLIAAKLAEYYLQLFPEKRVAFLVPTRPLVEQQSEYCKNHIRLSTGCHPVIQKLFGQDQAHWLQSDWDDCMRTNHILLGTAALFQKAFVTDKRIDIGSFSLIVFDECHNCCGNSPMAAVMRDGVAPYQARGFPGPRILGLTASFINGNLRNMEMKRRDLETLLLSVIFCPRVPETIAEDKFKFVPWSRGENASKHKHAVESHVEYAVKQVGTIKELGKIVRRCTHVFEELGSDALLYYIDKVIVDQIIARVNNLKDQPDIASSQCASRMMHGLPRLRKELDILREKLTGDPLTMQAEERYSKKNTLVILLRKMLQDNGPEYRGIVFVEQVALVSSLAKVLNDSMPPHVRCGAVAGTGYQSERDRQTQLDKFRSGEIRILAATASLEEGIDVPECAFVVRYTSVATTKAHIQGAGRARHPNAVIYYFENNPRLEQQKAAAMIATARNTSLSLSNEDFQDAMKSTDVPLDQRHPYPFRGRESFSTDGSGEVNVYNCKQIFNQYCSITLGASLTPKRDLYKYSNNPGDRKLLNKIRYPTPNGWRCLSFADYQSFWGQVNMDSIFCAERVKRKSSSDKEEMAFVYIVVVLLRQDGHLDGHNSPVQSIIPYVKRTCPLNADWSDAIAITNKVFQSY